MGLESTEVSKKTELAPQSKGEVALKYLELARSEIQDKINFVNTTLGGYLIGVATIAAWFYQIYRPTDQVVTPLHEQRIAVGLALILSYISLGVSWIINHNERMVTALALYQRCDLLPALGKDPPMWECSSSLRDRDEPRRAVTMICVQQMIIIAPPVAALVVVIRQLPASTPLLLAATCAAIATTVAVIVIGLATAVDRWEMRGAPSKSRFWCLLQRYFTRHAKKQERAVRPEGCGEKVIGDHVGYEDGQERTSTPGTK